MRFEAALPPWYRGEFDHLPPEEARRRLTILYRLVYPFPSDMPEAQKATNAAKHGASADRRDTSIIAAAAPPRPAAPGTNPF